MEMKMLKYLRMKMILDSLLKDQNKNQFWRQHNNDLQINTMSNNNNKNNCLKIMLQPFDTKRITIDQQFEEAPKSREIKEILRWVLKNQIILVKKAALPQGHSSLLVLLRRIVLLEKIKGLDHLLEEDFEVFFFFFFC